FTPVAEAPRALAWRVAKVEPRSSRVVVDVSATGVSGQLTTFVRPRPQPQPTAAELVGRVRPGSLDGVRLLVVGGSRGLGEVLARLAGGAGAVVSVTCHRGQADAEAVAADAGSVGGPARTARLDVEDPAPIDLGGWSPTHLAWFTTPRISLAETT